jgi:hypothetical protein
MRRLFAIVLMLGCAIAIAPVSAQGIPPLIPNQQNRIPAPLPPPPEPPVIYGPNNPYVPQVYMPPHLNTFSDRVSHCLQQGSSGGLRGGKLSRYTRACANDN